MGWPRARPRVQEARISLTGTCQPRSQVCHGKQTVHTARSHCTDTTKGTHSLRSLVWTPTLPGQPILGLQWPDPRTSLRRESPLSLLCHPMEAQLHSAPLSTSVPPAAHTSRSYYRSPLLGTPQSLCPGPAPQPPRTPVGLSPPSYGVLPSCCPALPPQPHSLPLLPSQPAPTCQPLQPPRSPVSSFQLAHRFVGPPCVLARPTPGCSATPTLLVLQQLSRSTPPDLAPAGRSSGRHQLGWWHP